MDYRALKYALNEIHWDEEQFSGSIRATIHQKKVLGLRVINLRHRYRTLSFACEEYSSDAFIASR